MKPVIAAFCLALIPLAGAHAQSSRVDLSGIDPMQVIAGANDVLLRAPDADVDRLFKAVHAASRNDNEARGLCALFEPDADRSLVGLQRAANALGETSRIRFVEAVTAVAVNGLQGQPQAYDPAVGEQALKAATVTGMMLHDGFMLGLSSTGRDSASRDARCTAFRQLVDVLDGFSVGERVAATRYLLREGLDRYGGEL
ncbi:hypothetical protein FZO89_09160 [Luteimonas viscosa]|uniref:Uncharacterized protein n=1 Tax=Luteimonas viscosa TaxID=1132694 RepID=A0A5D4XR27_9GAMM|nr:hypothetical protein [Luteimonas viscosa]TYT26413.1 hypothetical protein FZO89_09160 [Luteimonas viscosa]